jgi:hypothetical protein
VGGREQQMGVDFKTAEKEIESILREFVQDWMGAASLALEAANKPKPETRSYWVLALAGNLAWAIGGFFPVTNALKLVILGAAVLGADTTTKVAEKVRGDPPTPEKLLAGRIAETADALELYSLNQSFKWEWAKNIQPYDLAAAEDYDAARKFVWEKMVFINIEYRKRRKQLLDKMIRTIESQVSSFNTQWQQWKSDTKK